MKAISKKLLSLLVVIAMVLSMVPFGGLSIFAVETKATTTEEETEDVVHTELPADAESAIAEAKRIQEEAATLDFSGSHCPACGATDITWTKLESAVVGATSTNADVFKTNRHFYWDPADFTDGTATMTSTQGYNWLQMTSKDTGTGSICLHLNGIKLNLDKGRVHWSDAKDLNIMGSGEVNTGLNTGDGDFYGLFQIGGKGTINLYGGTYTNTDATLVEPNGKYPETTVYGLVGIGTAATFNIYDGVTLQSAGTNVVMSNKGVFNMYGGTITGGTGYDYAYDGTVNTDKDGVPATDETYTNAGGNVYLRKSGTTFNMYDGNITGGTAALGGNVMVHWDAAFNQYGGAISGGTATATDTDCYGGGNFYVGSIGSDSTYIATLTQHGGTISGGSAYQGGSILTKFSEVEINGTVDGGTSTSGGGSVWVSSAGQVGTTSTWKYSTLTVGSTGVIKNGVAEKYGGSVAVYGNGKVFLQGGKIKGGTATTNGGGNIYMTSNGTFQMTGGELSGGIATGLNGGNFFSQNASANVDITGGTISGGQAKNGGNLYVAKCSDLQITGEKTEISGGQATAAGGNIFLSGATCNIGEGTTISGGKAVTYGGNICAQQNGTEGADTALYSSITTAGKIIDGQLTDGSTLAASGGNISITARTTLTVNGGEIARGVLPAKTDSTATQTGWGGNIRAWNSNVTINGGNIYAGDQAKNCSSANKDAANIGCMGDAAHKELGFVRLNVSGGTITGDVKISATQTSVSVSGDAKIVKSATINGTTYTANYNGLYLGSDSQVTVGSLNEGAEICVSGNLNRKINVADAAVEAQADHFTAYAADRQILWDAENNVLYIAEKVAEPEVDVFAPWDFDGKAYCPVCYANGDTEVKTWVALNSDGTADNLTAASTTVKAKRVGTVSDGNHYHVYFEDDHTYNGNWGALTNKSTLCLHTNGKTVGYQGRLFVSGSTLNIMGDGTITSDGASSWGDATLTVAGGTLNLYGGTIKSTSTDGNPVLVVRNAAKVTMEDGVVLDGTGVARCVKFECTSSNKGTFTMNGGTIQNGYYVAGKDGRVAASTATMLAAGERSGGGNVWVEYGTFTMNGGEITGGNAVYSEITDDAGETTAYTSPGGNVYVASGASFVMNSGIIKEGKANNTKTVNWVVAGGGNIYSLGSVTLNGGTVQDGKACGTGGNIHCAGGTLTIGDGTATIDEATNKPIAEITISGGKTGVTIGEATLTNGYGGNIGVTAGTATVQDGALITGGSTVSESATGGYGGNIYTFGSSAKVYIKGGTVTGGQSGRGGNIDMNNGTVEISGGTVSEGTSTGSGGAGNVYVQNKGTLKISGDAYLFKGTAKDGGNIKHTGTAAKLEIIGGTIEGGNATRYGGNIYSDADNGVSITGGHIYDGTAASNGGNIYANGLAELTVNGSVKVENGTASTGGNIYATGITGTIELGGTWNGGETTSHRGNIALLGSNVNISGATITGGVSKGQCGTLGLYKCPTVTIENSTITGGTAASNTGTLWIATNAGEVSALDSVVASVVTITNSTVTATDDKDAIDVAGGCTLVLDGTTSVSGGRIEVGNTPLKDNTATEEKESATSALGKLEVKSTWAGTADLKLPDKYYCGDTLLADNISADGAFSGTLMNVWGDNAKVLYNAEDGSLYLAGYAVVDTANGNATEWYGDMATALTAANGSTTKYLLAGADVAVDEGVTVYVDALNDIKVTGSGTVYGIEPANADFETKSTGTITAGDTTVNLESDSTFNGVRYLKIANGSYHAIEMGVTGVSLRPTAVGLYYKATYKCDADLAAAITAYGVVLSVNDMPGDDFADVATDQFTVREDFSTLYAATTVANTVTANSGSVFGIMKESKDVADNAAHGVMKIYANAYILVNGEAIYVADTENCGKEAGVALSLYDVMAMVDQKWDTLNLSETQIGQINDLFDKCKAWGGVDWTFTNITGTTV